MAAMCSGCGHWSESTTGCEVCGSVLPTVVSGSSSATRDATRDATHDATRDAVSDAVRTPLWPAEGVIFILLAVGTGAFVFGTFVVPANQEDSVTSPLVLLQPLGAACLLVALTAIGVSLGMRHHAESGRADRE